MLLVISFSIGNKVHSSCGALHGLPKDNYQGTPVLHIGESRTTYDSCYHRKAANIKSLEWGWAKAFLCCVHRSSELHSSTTWPDVPTLADMQMEGPPRKTRHINGALRLSMRPLQQPAMESVDLHPYCKFPHLRTIWSGHHSQSHCPHSNVRMEFKNLIKAPN